MYIEELIIDGFKSYQHRTTIAPFDPNFNAITGLNGSGKSNIIDAIIFVLGVTNWSQLRASSLQSLVYKQGQAGIRKASVTIVFNNMDKNNSPVGYEKHDHITVTRQIVIGGRSKYLINGHNAQPDRVKNLFRSVQLNIKNPHFLIMQGRITKVVNAKPAEILAMIEEAAGTKMYEDKKEGAIKTIEKKNRKVEEIDRILDEKITPTLQNLEKQQKQYHQWLEFKREFERLDQIRIAYDYYTARSALSGSSAESKDYQEKIKEQQKKIENHNNDLQQIKKKIQKLTEKKEKQMAAQLRDQELIVDEQSKQLVKQSTIFKNLEETVEAETHMLEELRKQAVGLDKTIAEKERLLADKGELLKVLQKKQMEKKEQLENLKKQYQAVSVGVAADGEGTAKTLADQLMDAKSEQTQQEVEARSIAARLEHAKRELEELSKTLKNATASDQQYKQLVREDKELRAEIEHNEEELKKLNFSEEQYNQVLEQSKRMMYNIKMLQERITALKMRLAALDVHYTPPTPDWDGSKVHGRVARLVTIKDPQYSMALEIAAGSGRLMNIVVHDEDTSKAILKDGRLRDRETFIPLNKIQTRPVSDAQLTAAYREVGKANVASAMSLVEYDKADVRAVEYVFGSTLVCHNSEDAKTVTFHENVRARCVTLEGDLFDPVGTLTGGAPPKSNNFLGLGYELHSKLLALEQLTEEYCEIDKQLKEFIQNREKHYRLVNQVGLDKQRQQLLQQRISQTDSHQHIKKVEDLKLFLQTETEKLSYHQHLAQQASEKVTSIQHQIQHFDKETQLQKTKQNMTLTKQHYKEATREATQAQHDGVKLSAQIEQHVDERRDLDVRIRDLDEELRKKHKTLTEQQQENRLTEGLYEQEKKTLEEKIQSLKEADSSLAQLLAQRDATLKEVGDAELEIKKYEHKIESYKATREHATKVVENLKKQYSWIETEEQYFGKQNSDFNFDPKNMKTVRERLAVAEEGQERLSKQINKKSVNMFEKAQQEYLELMKKKKQIKEDKAQIENFIAELDKKKNEALQKTWEKVNKDFNSIFSTLLQGAMSKLEPQEGQSFLDGLVVRVGFGGVWKDSLSELSGGQRSLVSLSLVLALLLFKPAPMYILDEIDSALDLSHTQNIGEMLKTHFTQSQFIIISLKEGMYNNANVLFSVQNVNGASVVTRTECGRGKKRKRND